MIVQLWNIYTKLRPVGRPRPTRKFYFKPTRTPYSLYYCKIEVNNWQFNQLTSHFPVLNICCTDLKLKCLWLSVGHSTSIELLYTLNFLKNWGNINIISKISLLGLKPLFKTYVLLELLSVLWRMAQVEELLVLYTLVKPEISGSITTNLGL